jgi:hypothetical protein
MNAGDHGSPGKDIAKPVEKAATLEPQPYRTNNAKRLRGERRSPDGPSQQPAMPVIGFLDPRSLDALGDRLRGFRQGLKETGYVEGENVAIEYRWAENRLERLPELAADLARRKSVAV